MHLKQLSDCSCSESDKYTESRMKLVEGECLSEEEKKVLKVVKSRVVSPNWALTLSYPSSRLAVATS